MFDHALEAEGSVLVELGYQGDAFFPVQLCGKLAELLQYLADDGFHGFFRGGGKGLLGTVIAAVFGGGRAYLVFQGGDSAIWREMFWLMHMAKTGTPLSSLM